MVLDHSGPDLAYLVAASAIKLGLLGALIVGIVLPVTDAAALNAALWLGGMAGLAVLVGVVESTMARLRLVRVPQLLVGATALSVLALVLEHRLA
jgi:formate hydrogenlyase subunit 4